MQLSIGVLNMLRHSKNGNLAIHNESTFRGFSLQVDKGPFIRQYLERLDVTIGRALDQHSRVFAFRVDLRFPAAIDQRENEYSDDSYDEIPDLD